MSKISLEHTRFSRRKKYHKNRSNFPGELSQNFVRTDTIFQETIPPRTDILQYLVGCFRMHKDAEYKDKTHPSSSSIYSLDPKPIKVFCKISVLHSCQEAKISKCQDVKNVSIINRSYFRWFFYNVSRITHHTNFCQEVELSATET